MVIKYERSEEDLMRDGLYAPGSFDQSLKPQTVDAVRQFLASDHRGRPFMNGVTKPFKFDPWEDPEGDIRGPDFTVEKWELDRAYHRGQYDTTEWWVAFNEFDQWVAADKVTVLDKWDDKLYYGGGSPFGNQPIFNEPRIW